MARRRLPKFLSAEEAARLVDAASTARDKLIVLCGLLLGLRVSEIRNLRAEDVNVDQRLVFVRAGKGDRDRNLPLPGKLLEPMTQWLSTHRTGWLFPSNRTENPIGSRVIQLLVKALGRKAAIARTVTPHVLRHTFATALLHKGADLREVQELLGHSSVAITEIYTHCTPDRLRAAMDRL